jgi:tetratricopeptide (TPR) repeat protein
MLAVGLAKVLLAVVLTSHTEIVVSQDSPNTLPVIDRLWDYNDPAASEAKFRDLLTKARAAGNLPYAAEVMTQIARAQGLQQKYAEANQTLDETVKVLTPEMKTASVRVLLERGRVLNSSGSPEKSRTFFVQALQAAQSVQLDYYAIDAAHMLGIVYKGNESITWNERAMQMAEATKDSRARGWLGPLYNNLGWTYADLKRYDDALKLFEKDIRYRTEKNAKGEAGIARWSAAKMMRMLGRVDEALRIQQELLQEPDRKGNDAEGYSHEEIAECLLLLGRQNEAKPHFARAWELLRNDPWLKQDEPQRLERLKQMGGLKD